MTHFPSVFQNPLADTSQNNLHQQPISHPNYAQKPLGSFNQQNLGNYNQQHQPQQQQNRPGPGEYVTLGGSLGQQCNPQPYGMPCPNPASYPPPSFNQNWPSGPSMQFVPQAPMPGCPSLIPQSIMEQMRACPNVSTPIFILPSGSTTSATSCGPLACFPGNMIPATCFPYPVPMPIYQHPSNAKGSDNSCKCSPSVEAAKNTLAQAIEKEAAAAAAGINSMRMDGSLDSWAKHRCEPSADDLVCVKKNCPASIQLQAMVSHLLGVQGIIPSAITRILLKKIPGANINESIEETMERAQRCIRQLTKDQLLKESKASQDVHALLGIYMTSASTLPRIIPILTNAQLKCNILKALVESLVNAKIAENQGYGAAEPPDQLDGLLLELKSNAELRQLLSVLREKECEERVNLSFAACSSQRLIAESRLSNVQRKIEQVEREMERRRCFPASAREEKRSVVDRKNFKSSSMGSSEFNRNFDVSDPFIDIRVTSPKKLLLKPHVGSPETTYEKPSDLQKTNSADLRTQCNKKDSFVSAKDCMEDNVRDSPSLKRTSDKDVRTSCRNILEKAKTLMCQKMKSDSESEMEEKSVVFNEQQSLPENKKSLNFSNDLDR